MCPPSSCASGSRFRHGDEQPRPSGDGERRERDHAVRAHERRAHESSSESPSRRCQSSTTMNWCAERCTRQRDDPLCASPMSSTGMATMSPANGPATPMSKSVRRSYIGERSRMKRPWCRASPNCGGNGRKTAGWRSRDIVARRDSGRIRAPRESPQSGSEKVRPMRIADYRGKRPLRRGFPRTSRRRPSSRAASARRATRAATIARAAADLSDTSTSVRPSGVFSQ